MSLIRKSRPKKQQRYKRPQFRDSEHFWAKYTKYLESARWKKKRERALKRDDYKCTECGSMNRLQVHHLTYKRIFYEYKEDLMTLCHLCHKAAHGKTKQGKPDMQRPRTRLDAVLVRPR